jgi:hypothetical protein
MAAGAYGDDLLINARKVFDKLLRDSEWGSIVRSLGSFGDNEFRYLPVETMSRGDISPEELAYLNRMLQSSDFVDPFKDIHNLALRVNRGYPLRRLEVVPGRPDLSSLRPVFIGDTDLPVQVPQSSIVPLSKAMREASLLALSDRGMDTGPLRVFRDMNYMNEVEGGIVTPRPGRTAGALSVSYRNPFLPPAQGGPWYTGVMDRRNAAWENPQLADELFNVSEFTVDPSKVLTADFVSPSPYLESELQFLMRDLGTGRRLNPIEEMGIPQYRVRPEPDYDPEDYWSGEG